MSKEGTVDGHKPKIVLQGIDFLLTYRCNGECGMCTYFCSPRAGGLLSTITAVRALADTTGHPLRWVMLFGGEPFLTYTLLLELARETKRMTGVSVSVFTNAFWATSQSRALALLKPLREAGVDCLYLSLDLEHAYYVPPRRVTTAALTACRLGLQVFAEAKLIPGLKDDDPAALRASKVRSEFINETGLEVKTEPYRATGRAAEMPDGPPEDLSLCRLPGYLGNDLATPWGIEIHPGGEVCLCAGISLGNLKSQPLADILAAYSPEEHPVLGPLLRGGPGALLEMAVERGRLEPGVFGLPMTRCRACYLARKALRPEFPGMLEPSQCYGNSIEHRHGSPNSAGDP